MLNPKTTASRLRGTVIMGIGQALTEEVLIDPRNGRLVNASLAQYHVLTHADVPVIDVDWLDDPDPSLPAGVIGSVKWAWSGCRRRSRTPCSTRTGRRVRDLPITLDKVV